MKPALILTLCLATVLRAEEPAAAGNGAPPDPAPVQAAPSPVFKIPDAPASTAQPQVSNALPKYDPTAPKESGTNNAPSPDAIELPKMKVSPKPRPRLTPDIVVTNKGLDDKVNPLDGKLLNKFTLPGWMGGVSAAERAREEQQRQRKEELKQDVDTMARALETVDPAQAKALRDAAGKP
jgi:hypothetical protein